MYTVVAFVLVVGSTGLAAVDYMCNLVVAFVADNKGLAVLDYKCNWVVVELAVGNMDPVVFGCRCIVIVEVAFVVGNMDLAVVDYKCS